MIYPWIKSFPVEWPTVIAVLKDYKRKLYYCSVKWRFPGGDRVKCNIDRANKAYPGSELIWVLYEEQKW